MTVLSEAALTQQRLWSADPQKWALLSEPHTRPLFDAVLGAAHLAPRSRLLDVGCGTGMLLALAQSRGATVTGLDVSPGMLDVARRVVPTAELVLADLQRLPFADGQFDVVTGVNSFAFAEDPKEAFTEAARVCAPGGRVVVANFAEPERNESTAVHEAMSRVLPAQPVPPHAPYALSVPGNLEAALAATGLLVDAVGEVQLDWHYENAPQAIEGLAASGGGTRAVELVGLAVVERAIAEALVPFTAPDGTVTMHNVFRWVAAEKV